VIIQTTLACGPTIERELLQLQGDMGKVIGANYSEIIKTFIAKPAKEKKEPKLPTDDEIIDRV
jgi:translation initiation factor 1 (eIF-1/SUI1)